MSEDGISVDVEGGVVVTANAEQEGAGVLQSLHVQGNMNAVEAMAIEGWELTVLLHAPIGVIIIGEHPRGSVHFVRKQPVAVSLNENGCYAIIVCWKGLP